MAPACGEHAYNAQGKQLLELVERRGLSFLSSQLPDLTHPACVKHGSSNDYMFASGSTGVTSCYARTLPHDSAEVQACLSDHAPVLAYVLHVAPSGRAARVTQRKWRLENLQREPLRKHFRQHMADHGPLVRDGAASATSLAALEVAAAEAQLCFAAGATECFGMRTIVQGVTKRAMNKETAQQARHARSIHLQMLHAQQCGDTASTEELRAQYFLARRQTRIAVKRNHRLQASNLARRTQRAFASGLKPYEAHRLLRQYNHVTKPSRAIACMRHPVTGAEHSTAAGILECLTHHHSTLCMQRTARDSTERAIMERASSRVAAWRRQPHAFVER